MGDIINEKLFTELRTAQATLELAQLAKQESTTKLIDHLVKKFESHIAKHAGEKFAITIDGSYTHIDAYGIRNHQTSTRTFKKIFTGFIDSNPIFTVRDARSFFKNQHPFPAVRYISGDNFHFRKAQIYGSHQSDPFHFDHYEKNGPCWSYEDFLRTIVPEDIRKILVSKKFSTNEMLAHVNLWIGDDEYEKFLTLQPKAAQEEITELMNSFLSHHKH